MAFRAEREISIAIRKRRAAQWESSSRCTHTRAGDHDSDLPRSRFDCHSQQ